MKLFILFFFLVVITLSGKAQTGNDNCGQAIHLNAKDFCSTAGAYTTVGATPSFNNGNDVWFKFTAVGFEVNITITGNTLQLPRVGMMNNCNGDGIVASTIVDGNSIILTKAGLTPGTEYFIWVSGAGNNTGTFQLCIKNYNPPSKPGQDNETASTLCSTTSFPVINLTGAGTRNNETAGTCLPTENNSVWYKWIAANSGSLVFTITPTKFDDLDWVLYDLGPATNPQTPSSANAIRCAAGHGVNNSTCPSEPLYTKTGLDFNAQDLSEGGGCGAGQDGVVRFVQMEEGHVYYLIVDNFSNGNNGFTLDFTDRSGQAGSGTFVGPTAPISMSRIQPCTIDQNYVFSTTPTDYSSVKWYFGSGASRPDSEELNPGPVSYSTAGEKTVVLEVISDRGCSVINSITFTVGLKPDLPVISGLQGRYCIGETINLSTQAQDNATYSWTGPMGFTSNLREISIPVDAANKAGDYQVVVSIFDCVSDPVVVRVPPIGQTPIPSFEITSTNVCTPQQSFTFRNTSTQYTRLRWNFGDGASIAAGAGNESYTVTYSTYGVKNIILEAEGSSGCVRVLTRELNVNLLPTLPTINSNKPDFCLTDTIRLSTLAQSDVTYNWTGPNNFSSNLREVEVPVNSEAVAGVYSLILTRGDCSTQSVTVTIPPIYKNPIAAFRSVPNPPARLSIPIRVRFFNESLDADAYLWDFGDGTTSTEVNPEHVYTSTGNFEVTLTVYKSTACEASIIKGTYIINDNNIIFVPNTFTPNNDGTNDEFIVNMSNIKEYRIEIFNRYGTSLFLSSDIFDHWNGMYNNEFVPVGTYYYTIDALDFDDKEIKKSGSVTILK